MPIVYKLTCSNTGKSYIGYSKLTIKERWKAHCKKARKGCAGKLFRAIRKHGEDTFTLDVLAEVPSKAEALRLEVMFIASYDTVKHGYNITLGGEGGNTSPAPRNKKWNQHISDSLRGVAKSAQHREHMKGPRPSVAGKNNPFFSKTHSVAARLKIPQRSYAKGEKHHLYGKPTASSFKPGAEHPRSSPTTVNGVVYGSISLAAKALHMTRPKLQRWIKSGKSIPPAPSLQGRPSILAKQASSSSSSQLPAQSKQE